MRRPAHRQSRAAALLAAGALAAHQLRYLVGYGDQAGDALQRQGHAYLSIASMLVGVGLAFAGWRFLRALAGVRRGEHAPPGRRSFLRVQLAATVALIVIYVVQESLEALLSDGHPAGLAGVFGNGGWSVALLALAIGALIALLLRGAELALQATARRALRPLRRLRAAARRPPSVLLPFPTEVLARHLAGRAPPADSFA